MAYRDESGIAAHAWQGIEGMVIIGGEVWDRYTGLEVQE
jgi:hypothetical protein